MDTTTLLWTVTNSNFFTECQWLYGVIGRTPSEKINTSKTVKKSFLMTKYVCECTCMRECTSVDV